MKDQMNADNVTCFNTTLSRRKVMMAARTVLELQRALPEATVKRRSIATPHCKLRSRGIVTSRTPRRCSAGTLAGRRILSRCTALLRITYIY